MGLGTNTRCFMRTLYIRHLRNYSCAQTPPERRGSGDVQLIARASLTLIAFCREFSNRQSYCRKHNLWLQHRKSLATSAWWHSTFLAYSKLLIPRNQPNVTRPSPCRWGLGTRLILRMPDVQCAHETSCFSSQAHTQLSTACSSAGDGQLSGSLGTRLAWYSTQHNRMVTYI